MRSGEKGGGTLTGLLRFLWRLIAPRRRPAPAAPKPRPRPVPRPPAQPADDGPLLVEPTPVRPARCPLPDAPPAEITGPAWVVDGDTIEVGGHAIRLFGIDAPELDHPWGAIARIELILLCDGQTIRCIPDGSTTHDRLVARCFRPDGRDLSAEMVRRGLALDWPRFSGGAYRALEPPGARTRLWRVAARQRGAMPPR